VIPRICA